MNITYEGESYTFDFDDITVKQAIKIEKHMGMPLSEWNKALATGKDLRAMQAIGWLVLEGGTGTPIEECDFKVGKLAAAFAAAAEAEDAQEDPTGPATPPNGSTGASIPDLSLPSSLTA